MKFQKEARAVLGFGLVSIHVDSKNLATFCLFPENLSATGYRRNGLICMVEERPRQGSILAVSRSSLV